MKGEKKVIKEQNKIIHKGLTLGKIYKKEYFKPSGIELTKEELKQILKIMDSH